MKALSLLIISSMLLWNCSQPNQVIEDYHSIDQFEEENKKADQFLQQKQYADYLESSQELLFYSPHHPNFLFQVAKAYALVDQPIEAWKYVEKIIAVKGKNLLQIKNDSLMISVLNVEQLNQIEQETNQILAPELKSDSAYILSERDLIPEGVAYDSVSDILYIGSINKHKVISIDSTGQVKDFLPAHFGGINSILGLEVDETRRHLWFCSIYEERKEDGVKAGDKVNAVFKIDIDKKKVIKKYILPKTEMAFFNDLTVARNGAVYVTDSDFGKVYWIDPQTDELQALSEQSFFYPNGLALNDKEDHLFVATYGGMIKVNLMTRERKRIETPDHILFGNIDGLAYYNNSLIAHQGTSLNGVFRYHLDADQNRVVKKEVIDRSHPAFDFPTTGEFTKNGYCYIANAQLRRNDEKGQVLPYDSLADVLILRAQLE